MVTYTIQKPIDVVLAQLLKPADHPHVYLSQKGLVDMPTENQLMQAKLVTFSPRRNRYDGSINVRVERLDFEPTEPGHHTYNDRWATLASLVERYNTDDTTVVFSPPHAFYPDLAEASVLLASRLDPQVGIDMALKYAPSMREPGMKPILADVIPIRTQQTITQKDQLYLPVAALGK
jgi:hypothetical protein